MSIQLRIIEAPAPAYRPLIEDGTIRPGDMWRDDWPGRKNGEPGWRIVLPNGTTWNTWQPASDGTRWDVSGEAPALTVSPSIFDHSPGNGWHGFIRNGEFIDA
jgi:hypothetical protein